MAHRNPGKADGRSHALRRHDNIVGYLFMLPALLFFCCFIIIPMLTGFVTSLFDYTMKTPVSMETFVGLRNYAELFTTPTFYRALLNTLLIVVVAVPTVTAFSLWVASAITPMHEAPRSFFRCVFYLPAVTGTVAVVVVWKWMFDAYNGIFNWALKSLGIIDQNIMWLGDARFAIWCIILILFTTSVGQPIVLYVAALGNVDRSLVEAAEVDGATKLQTFWKIKWPSVMPTTLYVAIITTINSFQCFALIQLLTSGGPQHSTDTVMYYLYIQCFHAVPLWVCKRRRCGTGHYHCAVQCSAVQNDEHRRGILRRGKAQWKKNKKAYTVFAWAALCLLAFTFIFPLYWIVTVRLSCKPATVQLPPQWFPAEPTAANYVKLFKNPAGLWLWNSVFQAAMATLLTCFTASLAGYALAKKRFTGAKFIFAIFVCAMALPKQVVMVPLVRIMAAIGLYNTSWAVIFPTVGWPFGVFLMKQFSETLPSELLEAARIDGAGELRTFWDIVLPIVKPGVGALAIFTFVNTWNDYFMQLIMLKSSDAITVSLGIAGCNRSSRRTTG